MHDAWLRPLSPHEDSLLWQVVEGVELALKHDPALIVELLAVPFSGVISGLVNGRDQAQAAETAERLVDFMLERVDLLIAEQAADAMAEVPVAGHA